MRLVTRQTCRLCGSRALSPAFSLGDQYIASNFEVSRDFTPVQRRIPLTVVRCDPELDEHACGLLQLRHTVPPDLLYRSYGYQSGINATMTNHLHALVRSLESTVGVEDDDVVVDIGANDGTLLMGYKAPGARLVGFEPSNVAPEHVPANCTIVRDYFSAEALAAVASGARAKIVTSIAMFYDLDDPNRFVADVAALLREDGCWVLELSYLPLMLERNAFDTVCHEHLAYYALGPLESLLSRHGLRVVDVSLNDINGGSFRVWVTHRRSRATFAGADASARVRDLMKREFERCLDTSQPYDEFRRRIERVRDDLRALLGRLRAAGRTVWGYGASTKGNVILQYCGLDHRDVTAIADRNPAKWGTRTLGTGIPIVSEDEARRAKPDFMLVLPWHFMTEFLDREAEFIRRGGRFIVPLPDVRIVPGP